MSRLCLQATARALCRTAPRPSVRSIHNLTKRPKRTDETASPHSHQPCISRRTHAHSANTDGSSVNASEVSHFTKLASSWWDPHGPSRLLHLMNPLRHEFIQTCIGVSPGAKTTGAESSRATPAADAHGHLTYLDIGCGGGIFASSAARLPTTASVTAIDPTTEVIKVAKEHQRSDPILSQPGRLNYVNCAIEELGNDHSGYVAEGYDFVTVFEVIEHIDKPSAFLRQAMEHLKPGGWLVGSTIARHPISYITTKAIAEAPWPIGVVPPGTHDWNKYINPDELSGWFAKENRRSHTADARDMYGPVRIAGCIYVPLLGWRFVERSANLGNYFFGVQKL